MITTILTDDLDEVYAFLHTPEVSGIAKPNYYTLDSIIKLYGEICFVYRENGKILAVCLNAPTIDLYGAYIYLFVVDPKTQNNGIGKWFFSEVSMILKQKNYKKMILQVLEDNLPAVCFWQAVGFTAMPTNYTGMSADFCEISMERPL